MKIKQHLQKYIGYYFLGLAGIGIYLGESDAWWVVVLTLLKIPPFDWVGRLWDWQAEVSYRQGTKLKAWKEKQSRPIQTLFVIGVIILLILWFLFAPECELC
jgi:hypothetical protein